MIREDLVEMLIVLGWILVALGAEALVFGSAFYVTGKLTGWPL